jgi:hypothetical protein
MKAASTREKIAKVTSPRMRIRVVGETREPMLSRRDVFPFRWSLTLSVPDKTREFAGPVVQDSRATTLTEAKGRSFQGSFLLL